MKNGRLQPLLFLTCIFAAFLLGLFAGKALVPAPLQIQDLASPSDGDASGYAPAEQTTTQNTTAAENAIVNLNTATFEQLQALPGVGPVLAESILAYRDANGPFLSIADLANIPGIDVATVEAIWDYVTIGG